MRVRGTTACADRGQPARYRARSVIEGTCGFCYRNDMSMNGSVSHDRREETPEAKVRWFRSLPMAERMEMLCAFTDLALTVNPALPEQKNAQSPAGRIQVVSAT